MSELGHDSSIHPKAAAAWSCGSHPVLLASPDPRRRKGEAGPEPQGLGAGHRPRRRLRIAPRTAGSRSRSRAAPRLRRRHKIWNAPRVLSKLKGDFIAEVKVSGEFRPGATSTIPGRRPYHGAGLLLIKDKENYISLHRGCVYLDDKLRHYANFELRKDGELTISLYEIEIPDEDTYLRLERRGRPGLQRRRPRRGPLDVLRADRAGDARNRSSSGSWGSARPTSRSRSSSRT